ncbi:MAG: hypothetical protein U0793_21465 [Gemmataceae bacterium]
MFTVWLIWYVFIDVPHFFGTYARTYLDRGEFPQTQALLLGSLVFPLIGPALILVADLWLGGVALRRPSNCSSSSASLWAYWHVVRQHYGILALYKPEQRRGGGRPGGRQGGCLSTSGCSRCSSPWSYAIPAAEIFLPAGGPQPGS